MSDLINEIRHAQVLAGEAAVIAHLRKTGPIDKEPPEKNSKIICLQQRVKALEAVALQLIRRYVIDLPDYAQKNLDERLAHRAAELLEGK